MWRHRLALICMVYLHLCINVENSSLLTYQHVGHVSCFPLTSILSGQELARTRAGYAGALVGTCLECSQVPLHNIGTFMALEADPSYPLLRLRGGDLDSDSEFKINVPARPIEFYDDDDPYYVNVTQGLIQSSDMQSQQVSQLVSWRK